jgi:hypothetical protein
MARGRAAREGLDDDHAAAATWTRRLVVIRSMGIGRFACGFGPASSSRTRAMLCAVAASVSAAPSARLLLEWVAAAFLDRQNIRTEKIRSAAKLVTSIRSA